jgi:hypothetical protein
VFKYIPLIRFYQTTVALSALRRDHISVNVLYKQDKPYKIKFSVCFVILDHIIVAFLALLQLQVVSVTYSFEFGAVKYNFFLSYHYPAQKMSIC